MTEWIGLTDAWREPVSVAVDKIVRFEPAKDPLKPTGMNPYTRIFHLNGELVVRESYEDVRRLVGIRE